MHHRENLSTSVCATGAKINHENRRENRGKSRKMEGKSREMEEIPYVHVEVAWILSVFFFWPATKNMHLKSDHFGRA